MSAANKSDNFDELLKSLDAVGEETSKLAKPAVADDKKVEAAAADAKKDGAKVEGEGDDDTVDTDTDDGKGEGETFGKSLGADADGNDMVDATELVKSLMARQDLADGTLAKALTSIVGVMGKQTDLIKSLRAEVAAMSTQGRGRKTLLIATEKPGVGDVLAKGGEGQLNDGEITPADLLVKCEAANKAGAISGVEFNTVDVCLRNNWPVDAGILRKVAAATK